MTASAEPAGDGAGNGQDASRELIELRAVLRGARPFLILAPPRSASTALARSLLGHSEIGPYVHEPWDLFAHRDGGLESVKERLSSHRDQAGLLIKEMTFQLGTGPSAQVLFEEARAPVIFLIRDPRRTLESRIRRVLGDLKRAGGLSAETEELIASANERHDYSDLDDLLDEKTFPLRFMGWQDISPQIELCDSLGVARQIVRAESFRSGPERILTRLCAGWGLELEPAMKEWQEQPGRIETGSLPEQEHWYRRVQSSQSIEPETAPARGPERFPQRFRGELEKACDLYQSLCSAEI